LGVGALAMLGGAWHDDLPCAACQQLTWNKFHIELMPINLTTTVGAKKKW